MEDGDADGTRIPAALNIHEHDEPTAMANYPDVEVAAVKGKRVTEPSAAENPKVNGESSSKQEREDDEDQDVDTSDEDALVIDEDHRNRGRKRNAGRKRSLSSSPDDFKGFKKRAVAQSADTLGPTNKLDAQEKRDDGQGELDNRIPSEMRDDEVVRRDDAQTVTDQTVPSVRHVAESKQTPGPTILTQNRPRKPNKKSPNPKTEYAQYLGLQPTVKFKCCKCSESSFPSLSALNVHHRRCVPRAAVSAPGPPLAPATSSTNFRVTRKVYLCSACGTYYENCNLFLHMREVHRRFICLYCLGMFSLSDKLSQHLVTKHNCVPHHYPSPHDFLTSYKEACFLMCCDCEKMFTEQDDFFDHPCTKKSAVNKPCARGSVPELLHPNPAQTEESTRLSPAEANLPDEPVLNQTEISLENQCESTPKTVEEGNQNALTIRLSPDITQNHTLIKNDIDNAADADKPPSDNENSNHHEEPNKTENGQDEEDDIIDDEEEIVPEVVTHSKSFDNDSSAEDKFNQSAETMSTASEDPDKDEEADDRSDTDTKNETDEPVEQVEIRKVPKVTLKLPPQTTTYSEESDDSEKLTMEVDENVESEDESHDNSKESIDLDKPVNGIDDKSDSEQREIEQYQIAGDDISIVELTLEQPLDKFEIEKLLRLCLTATVQTCVYCNHARKIAVNGKQLGLHAVAEHRFSATVNSITAEELIPENFVARIKESLEELDSVFFSIEEKETQVKDEVDVTNNFKRSYECFQCRYVTTIHKELYLHNRKMHAKTILLCIMCKSNFYSYSELICHLCPGNYVLNSETKFRCCMCSIEDLPSAFRLMVHLRKRHHTCDVCLEGCHNQSKLSNHVWKHKLHHLCYRCGIAYRNKPDITKHLFWKHGTESVLCKKCLQKKWPHVYHFCVPPNSFVCEECNLSFSRAVYLKVHKRLHSKEKPHTCTEENCTEMFISKKLMQKHEIKHREPVPIEKEVDVNLHNGDIKTEDEVVDDVVDSKETQDDNSRKSPEKEEPKQKNIIDDIPALNLSESDSDSDEDTKPKTIKEEQEPVNEQLSETNPVPVPPQEEETEQKSNAVIENIWDNFKNYQATIEKQNVNIETNDLKTEKPEEIIIPPILEDIPDINVVLADHDYCVIYPDSETKPKKEDGGLDHDYCTIDEKKGVLASHVNPLENTYTPDVLDKKKSKVKKKKRDGSSSSSDSSSDSDSSSCTCGSNCSCSSSSGSSSSSSSSSDSDSSSSEGKRRIALRKERRKERMKKKKENEMSHGNISAVDVVATEDPSLNTPDLPIQESDLDTDETETDEDFYDEYPQRLANKLLAEKRNQLMMLAAVAPVSNGSILECNLPTTPIVEEIPKKKVKSKKRKKKSRSSPPKESQINIPDYHNHQTLVPPIHVVPMIQPPIPIPVQSVDILHNTGSGSETDSNVRSSKRRRVPNKFYGYSSDDENAEKPPAPPVLKWRKADLPSTPTRMPQYVPPITIKNIPSPAPIIEPIRMPVIDKVADSDSEDNQNAKDSSDSSDSNHDDSDSDGDQLHISQPECPPFPQAQRTNENLYCYCQCPYDEVSEMIACDGKDCAIEWFHFECVGIMVPPKGKWYCPDCRRRMEDRNRTQHS